MPITPKEVLSDPKFQAFSPEQKRQVLLRIDPAFVKLTPEQQLQVVNVKVAAPSPASPPSGLSRVWDIANRGFISPDMLMKAIGVVSPVKGKPMTMESLAEMSKGDPTKSPLRSAAEAFTAGTTKDVAETLSSFTSPASIATMGLGRLAKVPGALGKLARLLMTVEGMGYGAAGARQAAEGISQGVSTPEGARKALLGGAGVTGAAPTVHQIGRYTSRIGAALSPGLMARGDRAFIGSMRPAAKDVPMLRSAYNSVRPELEGAGIKDFFDLREFAEKQRRQAASEVNNQLARLSPASGTINALSVGDAVRGKVSPWMKLRADPTGRLPKEGRTIINEATNIEQSLLRKPLNIGEAEAVVQDINAELTQFRRIPPEAQRASIKAGDPVAVMTAVKEELQHQIEQRLAGYADLKKRYGAYKEIQRQTEKRLDHLARTGADVDWMQRRAMENVGGALGAIFSGNFLRGFADILAGRAGGDIVLEAARRPERILRRSITPEKPISFGGQIVQPIATGAQQ